MASRFATVSDDDILATNEAAIPTNNNTKFGLAMFTGTGLKNYFLTEFTTKSCKCSRHIPETLPIKTERKFLLSNVVQLQKLLFLFHPNDL